MPKVLVTIKHEVAPAKREAFLAHVREMREHAREILELDYDVFEHVDEPTAFTEVFTCASLEEHENLDERQDDAFRELVGRLDRFSDLTQVRYAALSSVN